MSICTEQHIHAYRTPPCTSVGCKQPRCEGVPCRQIYTLPGHHVLTCLGAHQQEMFMQSPLYNPRSLGASSPTTAKSSMAPIDNIRAHCLCGAVHVQTKVGSVGCAALPRSCCLDVVLACPCIKHFAHLLLTPCGMSVHTRFNHLIARSSVSAAWRREASFCLVWHMNVLLVVS